MFSLSQEPKRRVFTHTFMHAENKNSVSSITLRRVLGEAKMIRQNKTILKVPLLRPWVLVRTKITCKIYFFGLYKEGCEPRDNRCYASRFSGIEGA